MGFIGCFGFMGFIGCLGFRVSRAFTGCLGFIGFTGFATGFIGCIGFKGLRVLQGVGLKAVWRFFSEFCGLNGGGGGWSEACPCHKGPRRLKNPSEALKHP